MRQVNLYILDFASCRMAAANDVMATKKDFFWIKVVVVDQSGDIIVKNLLKRHGSTAREIAMRKSFLSSIATYFG